jgi:hypothetical protein
MEKITIREGWADNLNGIGGPEKHLKRWLL